MNSFYVLLCEAISILLTQYYCKVLLCAPRDCGGGWVGQGRGRQPPVSKAQSAGEEDLV